MLSDCWLGLFSFPKLPRGHALHALEETGKSGDQKESFSYFCNHHQRKEDPL
jgi:hypothetical protein